MTKIFDQDYLLDENDKDYQESYCDTLNAVIDLDTSLIDGTDAVTTTPYKSHKVSQLLLLLL